jgi:hypothetical protein
MVLKIIIAIIIALIVTLWIRGQFAFRGTYTPKLIVDLILLTFCSCICYLVAGLFLDQPPKPYDGMLDSDVKKWASVHSATASTQINALESRMDAVASELADLSDAQKIFPRESQRLGLLSSNRESILSSYKAAYTRISRTVTSLYVNSKKNDASEPYDLQTILQSIVDDLSKAKSFEEKQRAERLFIEDVFTGQPEEVTSEGLNRIRAWLQIRELKLDSVVHYIDGQIDKMKTNCQELISLKERQKGNSGSVAEIDQAIVTCKEKWQSVENGLNKVLQSLAPIYVVSLESNENAVKMLERHIALLTEQISGLIPRASAT